MNAVEGKQQVGHRGGNQARKQVAKQARKQVKKPGNLNTVDIVAKRADKDRQQKAIQEANRLPSESESEEASDDEEEDDD